MIRCTIELLPKGDTTRARTLGLVEIANVGGGLSLGDYRVVLTKTAPFDGALKKAWRRGNIRVGHEDEEIIVAGVEGMPRDRRGVYDLLFLALRACGVDRRCADATLSADNQIHFSAAAGVEDGGGL